MVKIARNFSHIVVLPEEDDKKLFRQANEANQRWPDYQNYRGRTMRICHLPIVICRPEACLSTNDNWPMTKVSFAALSAFLGLFLRLDWHATRQDSRGATGGCDFFLSGGAETMGRDGEFLGQFTV